MQIQERQRAPVGLLTLAISLALVALLVQAVSTPAAGPSDGISPAGAVASATATLDPATPTPSAVPEASFVPLTISGPKLSPEEVERIEEESAGDNTICPNGEECGFGEISTPIP